MWIGWIVLGSIAFAAICLGVCLLWIRLEDAGKRRRREYVKQAIREVGITLYWESNKFSGCQGSPVMLLQEIGSALQQTEDGEISAPAIEKAFKKRTDELNESLERNCGVPNA